MVWGSPRVLNLVLATFRGRVDVLDGFCGVIEIY